MKSPMESYGQGMQIKNLMQRNRMGALQLQEAEREAAYKQSPGYQRQLQAEQMKAELEMDEALSKAKDE